MTWSWPVPTWPPSRRFPTCRPCPAARCVSHSSMFEPLCSECSTSSFLSQTVPACHDFSRTQVLRWHAFSGALLLDASPGHAAPARHDFSRTQALRWHSFSGASLLAPCPGTLRSSPVLPARGSLGPCLLALVTSADMKCHRSVCQSPRERVGPGVTPGSFTKQLCHTRQIP